MGFLTKEVIGKKYLHRWHIIPPNRWLTVYVHKFVGDDFRIPHDHPAASLSIRLKGQLFEEYSTVAGMLGRHWGELFLRKRYVPRICFRPKQFAHRLSLVDGKPCWTLFIFFKRPKGDSGLHWGFYFRDRWVSWRELEQHYYGDPEFYDRWVSDD